MPSDFTSHNEELHVPLDLSTDARRKSLLLNKEAIYSPKHASKNTSGGVPLSHQPCSKTPTILIPQEINKTGRLQFAKNWLKRWISVNSFANSPAFSFCIIFSLYTGFCFESEETPLEEQSFLELLLTECDELSKTLPPRALLYLNLLEDDKRKNALKRLLFKAKFQEEEASSDSGCESVDQEFFDEDTSSNQSSGKDSSYNSDDDSSTNGLVTNFSSEEKLQKTNGIKSEKWSNSDFNRIFSDGTPKFPIGTPKQEQKPGLNNGIKPEDGLPKNTTECDSASRMIHEFKRSSIGGACRTVKGSVVPDASAANGEKGDAVELKPIFRVKRELEEDSNVLNISEDRAPTEQNKAKRGKWSETQQKVIDKVAAMLNPKKFESAPCFQNATQLSQVTVQMLQNGQLQQFLSTFGHSTSCKEKHPSLCFMFKRIFRHVSTSGSHVCAVKEVYGHILRLHLDFCKAADCGFPNCKKLRQMRRNNSAVSEAKNTV